MKKSLSLQKTIIRIVVVAYLILFFLLVCLDFYLVRSYQQEIRRQESNVVKEVTKKISDSMEYIKMTLYDIYTNNENFNALARGADAGVSYSHAYDLRQMVSSQMNIDDRWHAFYLFYNNNQDSLYYINSNKMLAEDASRIYQSLKQTAMTEENQRIRNSGSLTIDDNRYLLLGIRKGEAVIYGLLNMTFFENMIEEYNSLPMELCLIENGTVINGQEISPQLDLAGKIKEAQEQFTVTQGGYFAHGVKLDGSGIWGVGIYTLTWKSYINLFQIVLAVLTVFSCVAAFYIYSFLKKNMVQSLDDLRLKMEAIRRNRNNRILGVNARFIELQEVNETLDQMVEELDRQKMKAYEAYIEQQKAQMQFLSLQMKPHFYLNGLKALNALLLTGRTENVQNLIYSLSEHFRYLLHQESETTTLEKEIQFTANYCQIMDQMTGRQIQVEIRIPKETAAFQVPVLSLQTFAENSVKYAKVGSVDFILKITVEGCLLETEEGKFLDLIVRDNGCGYEQSVLDAINERQEDNKIHIGIDNLKQRCRILYGERAEFSFSNQNGAYSELIIPEFTERQLEE